MKYVLYRSKGNLERDIRQHQLVAVEYGKDIYDVTDALIKDVIDELKETPGYEKCEVYAYPPDYVYNDSRAKRYAYFITGVVAPPSARKNTIVDFGIIEQQDAV